MGSVSPQYEEYPPVASLPKDVYRPFPRLPKSLPSAESIDAVAIAQGTLGTLSAGLQAGDVAKIKSSFHASQAYWRDLLALTWHLRTFSDAKAIVPSLLELHRERGWTGELRLEEHTAKHVTVSPHLRWVEAMFIFETSSPAANCGGRVVLLPEAAGETVVWKIWIMSTWVDSLKSFPEDLDALKAPGQNLQSDEKLETDVFILGGGNAGLILAARLKALGVESIIIDRNAQAGDNWRLRYDCMKFHIGRHSCETPYLHYPDDSPLILTRLLLADHMKNYAAAFNLNLLNSSHLVGSSFDQARGIWTFRVHTPHGLKTIKSKHLAQCTGIGGSKPFIPDIPGEYKGINIHSSEYNNPQALAEKGVKSVIVVGSANSAFDVIDDTAQAGLTTTMIARSPTFIFPWDYAQVPVSLGMYEHVPLEVADKVLHTGPTAVDGQLARGLYMALASKEPDRYKQLAKAGFPVYDSLDGRSDLMMHLCERGGGHFNEIGDGVELIVSGKVKVKGNVAPVKYTATGLEFSDGTTVDADAIVWCTGFKDKDRSVTAEVLGWETFVDHDGDDQAVDAAAAAGKKEKNILGPHEIAALRDAVWGVDKEGEIRGCFKRNLRVDNFWVTGGTTTQHRVFSLPIAMQIKLALEGELPPAYRGTPELSS